MSVSDLPPALRLRFLVVNSFTGANLLLGVLALIAAASGATTLAAWGLLLCVLLDGCDGSLARRWNVTSEFGAQFDSLADMTSFIVGCATLIYFWVQPTAPLPLLAVASGLYALSGAVRLARFNSGTPSSTFFEGMPTTIVAAVLAANYLAYPALDSYGIIALVSLLAVLMVSVLPYPKLKTLRRHCPLWLIGLVLAGALLSPSWTVWLLTAAYVSLGPAIWLRRRLSANAQ